MRHDDPPTERRQGTRQGPPQPTTSSHTSQDRYAMRTRHGSSEDVSRWHTQNSQQSLKRPTSASHVRSEAPARYSGQYAPTPSRPAIIEYESPSRGSGISYAPAHPQIPVDHRQHQYAMQYGDLRRSRESQAYSTPRHDRGAGHPPLMAPTVLNAPYPQPPPQPPPPYVVHYPLPQPQHPSQNQLQPLLSSTPRGQLHGQEHPYQSEYVPSQPQGLFVPMSPAPSSYYQHENPQNAQGQIPYAQQEYGYHGTQRSDADNQQNSSRIGMTVRSNYPPNPGIHTAKAQYQVAPRPYHARVETPGAPQHPERAHSHQENGGGIRMVSQLAHDPRYVTAVPGDPAHIRQMASGTGSHVVPPSPDPRLHGHGVMPSHNQQVGQMRITPHLSATAHHPGAMPATHLAPIVSSFPLPQGHHQIGYQTNAYHRPTDPYGNPLHYTEVYMQPEVVHQYTVPQPIPKKKRLQWTPELHAKFEAAVREIGLDTAVPKTLLQAMNVPSLTRENVASHLQKYRDMVKKRKKIEAEEGSQDSKRGQKRTTTETHGTSLRFPEVRRRQRRRGHSGELVDDKEKTHEELREEESESTVQEEQRVERENTRHHCSGRSLGDQVDEDQSAARLAANSRFEISGRPVSGPFTERDRTRAVPRDEKGSSD